MKLRLVLAVLAVCALAGCASETARNLRADLDRIFHVDRAEPAPVQSARPVPATAAAAARAEPRRAEPRPERRAEPPRAADVSGGERGERSLAIGLKQYGNGHYAEAAMSLQIALDEGLSRKDQVLAHKQLAFIHCISGREPQCREEFRKALAIDPGFELAPAEAGHPLWGPVFRSVKAGR